MADPVVVSAQITEDLAVEILEFESFKKLLLAEQDALITGDTSSLTEITEKKSIRISKLDDIAASRLKHIQLLGFKPDPAGVAQWISRADAETSRLWKSLLILGNDIQATNILNGKLINTRLQYTQQTMSALLAAVNQAELYGPSGQREGTPQSSNTRGIIGKA
ncbi:MAG: flagella synthesis protein FlgN [Methylophilaceae bacterium]